jgi:hypothetical protein
VAWVAKRQRQKAAKKGVNRRLLYGTILVTIILVLSLVAYYLMSQSSSESWTAAIVDQLTVEPSLINQSADFNTSSTSTLMTAGFDVKYYPGRDITIDFYKNLPSKGSKMMVMRVHSTVRSESDFVDLFSSELFVEGRYLGYGDQISIAEFNLTGKKYFAIGPTFVNASMRGRFDSNTVIILMGCNSLEEESMAKALVGRGARVVIGWTDWIDLTDTDTVTTVLLEYLLQRKRTIGSAVDEINSRMQTDLGPPPHSGAKLAYYPSAARDFVVETREVGSAVQSLRQAEALSALVLASVPEQRDAIRLFDEALTRRLVIRPEIS